MRGFFVLLLVMNVREANAWLHNELHTDRWFFEHRGDKIVFLEKLNNTYNLIMPLTTIGGTYTNEVRDFHLHHAAEFVQHRRGMNVISRWDKKNKINSGEKYAE